MGDYTKLIVNCSVKKMTDEEVLVFKDKIMGKMGLLSSAYHAGGEVLEVDNEWGHRTDVTLVTQDKYGGKLDDFLNWLAPQVTNGCGQDDAWAMTWTEYQREPDIHYLMEKES